MYHKSTTKTLIFCTDYKGKDKFSTGYFIENLYEEDILPNDEVKTEIIWSDGPSSEFKNQFMRYLIEKLSICYNKPFSWKFSATSHGKGVVDGVGGKVKSSVRRQVMSFGKDRAIVQDAESFAKVADKVTVNTEVKHVGNDKIKAYKESDPFNNSVPVKGIFKMHVMFADGNTSELWRNSSFHQSGTLPDVTVVRSEDLEADGESQYNLIRQSNTIQSSNPLSYHDAVQVINGNLRDTMLL